MKFLKISRKSFLQFLILYSIFHIDYFFKKSGGMTSSETVEFFLLKYTISLAFEY
jgi:hypothetical protein